MTLQIVEILGPAEQGKSRPYLCRGEDDLLYYVKGRNTDRHSVWSEWLCAHLAREFGLMLPPFSLVEINPALIEETEPAWREVGVGIAFGSQKYPGAVWFENVFTKHVTDAVKRDILVFDWWIGNSDRLVANSNLLWDAAAQKVVVIDHNRAFDGDFSAPDFLQFHVFADVVQSVFYDLEMRARYAEKMEQSLAIWQQACDNAPLEWRWANEECDVPANFDPANAKAYLERCMSDELWRRR